MTLGGAIFAQLLNRLESAQGFQENGSVLISFSHDPLSKVKQPQFVKLPSSF